MGKPTGGKEEKQKTYQRKRGKTENLLRGKEEKQKTTGGKEGKQKT